MTRDQIKDIINYGIEEENGSRLVNEDSLLREADLDSFGHTVLFLDLDARFGYFKGQGDDPFLKIHWDTITLKDMIDRIEACS